MIKIFCKLEFAFIINKATYRRENAKESTSHLEIIKLKAIIRSIESSPVKSEDALVIDPELEKQETNRLATLWNKEILNFESQIKDLETTLIFKNRKYKEAMMKLHNFQRDLSKDTVSFIIAHYSLYLEISQTEANCFAR